MQKEDSYFSPAEIEKIRNQIEQRNPYRRNVNNIMRKIEDLHDQEDDIRSDASLGKYTPDQQNVEIKKLRSLEQSYRRQLEDASRDADDFTNKELDRKMQEMNRAREKKILEEKKRKEAEEKRQIYQKGRDMKEELQGRGQQGQKGGSPF